MKPTLLIFLLALARLTGAEPLVIGLWPGEAPGPAAKISGVEGDTSKPGEKLVAERPVIRLGNVSTPQMHVFLPPPEKATGAAVVVCPGGGFSILAWDLEGTEVAEWLNAQGIAALVLKYRVPTRDHGTPGKWLGPVMDAQRALSLARSRAAEWRLDPERLGVIGFSAGGETAAHAALKNGVRSYEKSDASDEASCAANFALLIYPGGLVDDKTGELKLELMVTKEAPPMFFTHAGDDRVSSLNSAALYTALKKNGVAAELHIFPSGGHGYGLRATSEPVTQWPRLAADWLAKVTHAPARETAANRSER